LTRFLPASVVNTERIFFQRQLTEVGQTEVSNLSRELASVAIYLVHLSNLDRDPCRKASDAIDAGSSSLTIDQNRKRQLLASPNFFD